MMAKLSRFFLPNTESMPQRRYDLDWLRVLAFFLLIFYHVGMLYVENWGFHVKSQYLSQPLQSVMLLVNPWRMLILWFISGVAIRFVLAKVSLGHFVVMRSYRLLLPLLFGVLVVVPPQLFYEMTAKGDLDMSYWQFYQAFFDLDNPIFEKYQAGIWPHIDVNHLWYLRELWVFSLYLIVLLPLLNSRWASRAIEAFERLHGALAIGIALIPIALIQFLVDETREVLGFLMVVYGYVFAWREKIWLKLANHANRLLLIAVVTYIVFVSFYNLVWIESGESTDPALLIFGYLVYSFDRLIWVLAILGLGYKYFNQSSGKLSYLSEAVYPYYILHQTIIIAAGYELTQLQLGGGIESLLVILITFASCAISFEVIRRVEFLRPFFGLKLKNEMQGGWLYVGRGAAAVLVLVIGGEILI